MRILLFLFIFFISIIAIVFSQPSLKLEQYNIEQYNIASNLLKESENLQTKETYSESKEEALNIQALSLFKKITPAIEKAKKDSLAFFCHFKTGLLYHYFDSVELAKKEYETALNIKNYTPAIEDSFSFQPLLFIARIYYSQNEFDSAYSFYKKAEKINEKYNATLNEQQRLYNGLGTMYFSTGNYKQAKNYFEKAIELLDKTNPNYKDFFVNYKINIASSLVRIERFKEADSIYASILSYKTNTNEVLQSMGFVNMNLGNTKQAISYFKKVNYTIEPNKSSYKKNIILYNQLGKAYIDIGELDSANKYLGLSLQENTKYNASKKNEAHGVTFQYMGYKFFTKNDFHQAVRYYQQAINQFYPDYNDTSITKNPLKFSGVFSYINLFNTLIYKADALEKIYATDKNITWLEAAQNAYHSAFLLAEYVSKTYDSDEARLFLNKMKYNVHSKPINISLLLFELTKKGNFLDDAYYFDQQNKASVLTQNIQEQELQNQPGFHSDLFEKEASIKTTITRLSLKAIQTNDSNLIEQSKTTIRDYEIKLSKLQDDINKLPGYRDKKFIQSIPTIAEVQKLLNKQSAILSYHLSEKELVTFCITKKELSYYKQKIDSSFFILLNSFKQALSNTNQTEKYEAAKIYKLLITPIRNKIEDKQQLLIIPDDELNNIPFEVLTDEKNNYLLNEWIVQYQYSTALLKNKLSIANIKKSTLALAPFTNNNNASFAKLTYSKNELENIKGNILMDTAATKENFLSAINKNSILHLATHTIVNDTIPEKSFIAFYPSFGKTASENNLYVQEIYNLKLDSTKLVILSACETGTGLLSKGEGLMSLSRAFTYAGCPNIISSLWKADDKSTAWIVQRFYRYYIDDYTAARALQQAKIDYLQSPEIEKRFKLPNYWAHLILTGVPEVKSTSYNLLWITLIIISIVGILMLYFLRIK